MLFISYTLYFGAKLAVLFGMTNKTATQTVERNRQEISVEWCLRSHSGPIAKAINGNRLRKNLMESQKNSIFAQ